MVTIHLSNQDLLAQKLRFFLIFKKKKKKKKKHILCVLIRSASVLMSTHSMFSSRNKINIYHNLVTLLSFSYQVLVPGQVN